MSFVALAMGGYVLVPIVHIYGRKEVAFILTECGADAYIAPAAYGHVDYTAIVDEAAPAGLRLHVVVGDGADRPAPAGIRRVGWDALESLEPVADLPTPPADEVAVLAYTSGTTSDPKGVIHDHRTMLSELRHMNGWVAGRATLMGSPVAHATGMLGAVLGPLGRGGDIHVIDRWDPGHALDVMAAYDISGGTGASIFLATLLDHPDFTPAHAANMERIGLGGAPVPVELGRRAEALGIKIIRAYGSTEHPSTTGSQFDDPAEQRHTTDGPVLPGVEIRLVDPTAPTSRTVSLARSCRGDPNSASVTRTRLLNDAFDDEGWYHTGDIGIVDEHGCLTITDRVKDIIIRGGENLSAAEIENAIAGVPGIAEVAVVAAPDARLGEHACAVDPDGARHRADRTRRPPPPPRGGRPGASEVARGTAHRHRLPAHRLRQGPQSRPPRLATRRADSPSPHGLRQTLCSRAARCLPQTGGRRSAAATSTAAQQSVCRKLDSVVPDQATTLRILRSMIWSMSRPIDSRIASPCSLNSGAGVGVPARRRTASARLRAGTACHRRSRTPGCSRWRSSADRRPPRACPGRSPTGRTNDSSRSRHSASVAPANTSSRMAIASTLLAISDSTSANRGSSFSSGRSMTSHSGGQYWPACRHVNVIVRPSLVR